MLQVRYAIDVRLTAPFEGSQGGNIFVPTKPELTHDKRAIVKHQSKSNLYRETRRRVKNFVFVSFIKYITGKIHEQGLSFLKKMARNASEHRDIPFETLLKYYIKVLNFALLKNIAKVICLKAVCSADAKVARQVANTFITEIVLVMSKEPHVSAHNILPTCEYILYSK